MSSSGEKPPKHKMSYVLSKERLMNVQGLPKLCKTLKKFRILEEGKEEQTLEALVDTYYLWARELHPRSTFPEFINSLSKLSHDKDVQSLYYELLESEYSIKIKPDTHKVPVELKNKSFSNSRSHKHEDDSREYTELPQEPNEPQLDFEEDDILLYRNLVRKRIKDTMDILDDN